MRPVWRGTGRRVNTIAHNAADNVCFGSKADLGASVRNGWKADISAVCIAATGTVNRRFRPVLRTRFNAHLISLLRGEQAGSIRTRPLVPISPWGVQPSSGNDFGATLALFAATVA